MSLLYPADWAIFFPQLRIYIYCCSNLSCIMYHSCCLFAYAIEDALHVFGMKRDSGTVDYLRELIHSIVSSHVQCHLITVT